MGGALDGIQPKVTLHSLLGPEYGGQTKDGGEGSKIRDWRRVKTSTARKLRPLPTSDEEQVPGTTKPNSAVCLQYTSLSSWQCPTSSFAGIKEKLPPALRAELHPSDRNGLHLVESLVKGGSIDLTLNITGFARATDGKALLLKMTLMSLNVDKLSWYPTRTGPLLTGTHCTVRYSARYWRQVTVNITQLQPCHL